MLDAIFFHVEERNVLSDEAEESREIKHIECRIFQEREVKQRTPRTTFGAARLEYCARNGKRPKCDKGNDAYGPGEANFRL